MATQRSVSPPERDTGIYCTFDLLLEKEKFVKDSFDNLYQEETLYKVELYVKRIREDSWPRNCFGFPVFLCCFVSFCFSALEQLNMVAFKN